MTKTQILKLRKKLKLTQEEFGKKLGVRKATVSDWETGKYKPSPMAERLLRIMKGEK